MALEKVKLSSNNVEYTKSINNNFSDLDTRKVEKETGKGLSTNDFTNELKTKLEGVEASAQVNKIETIKVNGTTQTITSKSVDITVPTTSQIETLVDGKLQDYDTSTEVDNKLKDYTKTTDLNNLLNNKVDKVTGKGLSTNDYTTAEKNKLAGIAAGAQVNVLEGVQLNGTDLTVTDKKVNVVIPSAAEYTIVEQGTAETGYSKTYYLTKDGTQVGSKINIPKDLVVESGEVKTVTTADQPYEGAKVGDKYIDLTIANATNQHIYIPVKDLVDVYTAGNGIAVSSANAISVKIDSANANGLATTTSGLKLTTATTSAAGAMSSGDKTKLEGIETGAQVNVIESVKVNGTAQTVTSKAVDISVPTAIFKTVKAGSTSINAASTTDTLNITAGSNITVTGNASTKTVTIAANIPEVTAIKTTTFTSTDSGWGAVDTDGNYTLTITNTGTPLVVKKVATAGGYETCMANLRHDGTKFYITADEKFSGQVYYFE